MRSGSDEGGRNRAARLMRKLGREAELKHKRIFELRFLIFDLGNLRAAIFVRRKRMGNGSHEPGEYFIGTRVVKLW